jgi:GNAT superfamily N-acetyltransferase
MFLTEVTTAQHEKEFIKVNVLMNFTDPNYIRPLDKDVLQVFDKNKNKTHRFGETIRWILKDEQGNLIGRIAAFVNKKYKTKGDEGAVGGVGFFECINHQPTANFLFDTAKKWLQEKGMYAMDGPINFGERDRWWGLQVGGFQQPLYCMTYNPVYYQQLFENYGFQVFFNQYCYALKVKDQLQEKYYVRHAELVKNPDYKAVHIKKEQLEKFAKDFVVVYNKAWAGHGGLKQMDDKQVISMFNAMKPVLDERISWFTYYKDEPIAIWLNIVDLNQWFKYLNGRFDWWGKLKFLWIKLTRKNKKFNGIIFGVIPEFQGQGVDSFMIMEAAKIIQGQHIYEDYELQWIGDFNPKMMNVAGSLGTDISRHLITYRYLFNREQEFKRHPMV